MTSLDIAGLNYTATRSGSELAITGNGQAGTFEALGFGIRSPTTWENIDIDISENNKLFIKIKSSVPNTTFRVDVQDIDGFVTT